MSECGCPFHAERESHLDALALVWLLGTGNREGYETILRTYLDDPEGIAKIVFALTHTALDALMAIAVATDRTPDAVLGGIREWVINHDG